MYRFLRVVIARDGVPIIEAMCTPPHWPFQRRILIRPRRDFYELVPWRVGEKSEKPLMLSAEKQIEAAQYFQETKP